MNSLFSINIPKRQTVCAQQGEKLIPGMDVFSLLTENESEKIIRRDFCSNCWTQIQSEVNLQKNRGYWKSTIEKKNKLTDASRAEQALALLRLLLDNPIPHEAEIFVLCLFLAHARQLALRKESVKEGITYYHYELLKRGEWITVKVVQLSVVEIETIQRSIADKLQTLMN